MRARTYSGAARARHARETRTKTRVGNAGDGAQLLAWGVIAAALPRKADLLPALVEIKKTGMVRRCSAA